VGRLARWWGEYLFTLEPTSNYTVDRPAMSLLKEFIPIPVTHLTLINQDQFQFETWPSFYYQPEQSLDLTNHVWTPFNAEISGSNSNSPATVTISATNNAAFYRVRTSRSPQ
jgi:hypothetical protein